MTADHPARRHRLRPVPVRVRITAAVVLFAGVALTGAGVAVYALETDRIDRNINEQIGAEVSQFEALQDQGGYTDLRRLMDSFLTRNVAAEDELLVGFWDDAPKLRGAGSAHAELANEPVFIDTVLRLQAAGGSRVVDTAFGEALVAVKPVADQRRSGAFVHVYFLDDVRAGLDDTIRTYALVAGACLILLTIAAWSISGRLLSPVRQLRDTAREISDTDLTRRIEATGNDDLTELTHTVNAMLDRIEGAFTAQRQFLDDAGHELRTPITIVRGHLELLNAHDPGEVLSTRSLLLDEVDRMSRLVDDLIMLAKARRPDFVRTAPADIGTLTDELVDKMRGLADRDWGVDVRAQGKAVIDAQRITQAMLQLASNAVRHTPAGAAISVGSELGTTHLRLWVRDDGDGIAPEDQDRIFDRFARGSQGVRDDGSGLGLAIVTAIAAAHSGRVELESVAGVGSTFALVIPVEVA